MTPEELDAALQQVVEDCESAGCPLTVQQQELLRRGLSRQGAIAPATDSLSRNPLDDLTVEQRQALLKFVQEQEQQNRPWKMQLMNDWLAGQSSGTVQFIRDRYGVQWLEQIQPSHLAQYAESLLRLKVGDRIEVCNTLWEWVQGDDLDNREWFPCTVVNLGEPEEPPDSSTRPPAQTDRCVIRFDNGQEYEIQGVYEWNRYNWRWLGEGKLGASEAG